MEPSSTESAFPAFKPGDKVMGLALPVKGVLVDTEAVIVGSNINTFPNGFVYITYDITYWSTEIHWEYPGGKAVGVMRPKRVKAKVAEGNLLRHEDYAARLLARGS